MNIYKKKRSFESVIHELYDYFGDFPKSEILNKFCDELQINGENVCKDAEKFNVTNHIYNQQMIDLYAKSNAFIFELVAASLDPQKIKKDNYISKWIDERVLEGDLNILCYGDGIGIDSQTHARNGHNVIYFEVEGYTSDYAYHRFRKTDLKERIRIIHDEKLLKNDHFDVIICREVLEHLQNPLVTMDLLWAKLKYNGICFLSESFSRVTPQFPTHLKSNLQFAGKTIEIMVKKGFNYVNRFEKTNLFVFQKTFLDDKNRFQTIPKLNWKQRLKKRIRKKVNYFLS